MLWSPRNEAALLVLRGASTLALPPVPDCSVINQPPDCTTVICPPKNGWCAAPSFRACWACPGPSTQGGRLLPFRQVPLLLTCMWLGLLLQVVAGAFMAIYAASLLGEVALTWVGFQGEPASSCLAPNLLSLSLPALPVSGGTCNQYNSINCRSACDYCGRHHLMGFMICLACMHM